MYQVSFHMEWHKSHAFQSVPIVCPLYRLVSLHVKTYLVHNQGGVTAWMAYETIILHGRIIMLYLPEMKCKQQSLEDAFGTQSLLPTAAIHRFLCSQFVGKRNSFISVELLYLEEHPNAQQLGGIIEISFNSMQYLPSHCTWHSCTSHALRDVLSTITYSSWKSLKHSVPSSISARSYFA